jgi:tRNA(Ile)-lysidine synthase
MKELFLQALKQLAPNYDTAKFLLAVSGGVDSCVMTHLFSSSKLSFDIAHCNFHLREEDSNADMHFVLHEMIPSFKNPPSKAPHIFVKEFDTYEEQKNSGKSIEMVARDLRYEWFQDLSPNYDYVCTAHHANDNAETLILNLTRGAGYNGLNGIPPQNGKIIRPLLHFTSNQINDYAKQNEIPFKVDRTNLEDQYQRNRIRNQVIPILETINPSVVHTFSKNIGFFNAQYRFYKNQINILKEQLLHQNKEQEWSINIADILFQPEPMLVLFEILSDFHFNYSTVEQLFQQLAGESGKQFFAENYTLIKDRTQLLIHYKTLPKDQNLILIESVEDFKKYNIDSEIVENEPNFPFNKNLQMAYFDLEKLQFPLVIRKWKEGDLFQPLGMKGKMKLSDFFINQKLSLFEKQNVSILTTSTEPSSILWIMGHRSDERYKVTKLTQNILILKIK